MDDRRPCEAPGGPWRSEWDEIYLASPPLGGDVRVQSPPGYRSCRHRPSLGRCVKCHEKDIKKTRIAEAGIVKKDFFSITSASAEKKKKFLLSPN